MGPTKTKIVNAGKLLHTNLVFPYIHLSYNFKFVIIRIFVPESWEFQKSRVEILEALFTIRMTS